MDTENSQPKPNGSNIDAPHEPLAPSKNAPRRIPRKLWSLLVAFGPPILTVVALALAIYQSYQAIKSEKEIRVISDQAIKSEKEIREISESVSTQYVNVFPDNMRKIIELVPKAQKSLVVVSDIGAYGHFSSPSNSFFYVGELNKLTAPDRGISIEFICYSRRAADKHLKDQFGWNNLMEAFKGDQTRAWQKFHDDRKDAFAEYSRWHLNKEPTDMPDLTKQISDATENLLTQLESRKGKDVIYLATETELPIFMWIVDGREAIFSFHTYGENAREHSFRTTDPRFIERLKEIKDELETNIRKEAKASASPLQPPVR